MDKYCLIITGGDPIDVNLAKELAQSASFLLGVDKGADFALELGLTLDLVVGDFDSISRKAESMYRDISVSFPKDKDFTDTELAISEAINRGYLHIKAINVTGDRIDHVLATMMLLYRFKNADVEIIGNGFRAFLVSGWKEIRNEKGKTFSMIPVSERIKNVSLSGFKYPLVKHNVNLGESLCVSNIVSEDLATIDIDDGDAIVIITNLEE